VILHDRARPGAVETHLSGPRPTGENHTSLAGEPRRVHCEVLGWPSDGPTLRLDYRAFGYAGKFAMSSTGKAVCHDRGRPVAATHDDPAAAFAGRDSDAYATDVLAAVAFNEDRTEDGVLWLRYVTVRADRRGDGLGPRLLAFVRDAALDRGYDRLRIAVNNPYSYQALYKTGFAYTGRETGIAELVLEHPAPVRDAKDGEDAAAAQEDDHEDAAAAQEDDREDAAAAQEDDHEDPAAARYREGLDVFADRDDLSVDEREFLAEKRDRGPPAERR
jgi:GNAT superfamily N-acetyltransferase